MTEPEGPGGEKAPDATASDGWLVAAHGIFWILAIAWVPVALLAFFWTAFVVGMRRDGADSIGFYVYLVLALFYAPALAVFGYAHGRGWSRFRNALRLGSAGYVGLLVAAVSAIVLFPRYPTCGPHAHVAAATAIPAIVFPMIAMTRSGGFSRVSNGIAGGTGVALLVASVAFFGRDLETSLPLTFHGRCRWEVSDWQDYSTKFLRADGVERSEAAEYAAALGLRGTSGSLDCPSQEWIPGTPEWSPPDRMDVWELDERVPRADLERYPNGASGCYLRAGWADRTLYVCDIYDWGN